eukprot:5992477-Pyramimonas_sp.AAC.1
MNPVVNDEHLEADRVTTRRNLDSQIGYLTDELERLHGIIRVLDEYDYGVQRFDWEIPRPSGSSERDEGQLCQHVSSVPASPPSVSCCCRSPPSPLAPPVPRQRPRAAA